MNKIKILENKKNTCILCFDNLYQLENYHSTIARYDINTKKLYLNNNILNNKIIWNYSQTTLKELKRFINNYTNYNYETFKEFKKTVEENKNIFEIKL